MSGDRGKILRPQFIKANGSILSEHPFFLLRYWHKKDGITEGILEEAGIWRIASLIQSNQDRARALGRKY